MNTSVNFKDTDLFSASVNPVWSKQIFLPRILPAQTSP